MSKGKAEVIIVNQLKYIHGNLPNSVLLLIIYIDKLI